MEFSRSPQVKIQDLDTPRSNQPPEKLRPTREPATGTIFQFRWMHILVPGFPADSLASPAQFSSTKKSMPFPQRLPHGNPAGVPRSLTF
jgi:hypothetical protein